jgi:hypothetical protein
MRNKLIYQVNDVHVVLKKKLPPILIVKAAGSVPTAGWKSPELSPYVYINPPADGIQAYAFIAIAPSGIVPQVITPIEAEHQFPNPPAWVRGVRVHASFNAREALIGETAGSFLLEEPAGFAENAKAVDLKVQVAKNSLAIDWAITLEGRRFGPGHFNYDGKTWSLDLPQFPVQGTLDAILEGRGIDNGVQRGRVAARIQAGGKLLTPELQLETIKMYGVDRKSYVV